MVSLKSIAGLLFANGDEVALAKDIPGEIESGSNSNGSWTKFPDGTLMCHAKDVAVSRSLLNEPYHFYGETAGKIRRRESFAVTYPSVFIDTPTTTYSLKGYGLTANGTISEGTSSFKIRYLVTETNDTVQPLISFIAIGRWK